ncbi:MAG: TolC family protein, partial [Blastocatellia bacterium]|nr:TolC family protein [Blastocatellia bacterium]
AMAQRTRDILVGTFYQHIGSDNTVGVNVSFPLLVYNKGYAAISQAQAQQESAISLARDAELQAITDVEKAYLAYQSARRILDIYSSTTIERAGRLKTIAALSYKEGATSLLDLLDAERCYNQTISSYNQARADYQSAIWQLEQAIGRPLR